jgi:hypothetical protein
VCRGGNLSGEERVSWRLGRCGVADTIEGGGVGGSGVAVAMVAVGWTVCCMRAAAAASSHEGSLAWLAKYTTQ